MCVTARKFVEEAGLSARIEVRQGAAIAELDADQRDVLLLITWAELTYDRAAEALDIPEGTARSRMNRARTRLRAALGGVDPTVIA